MTKQDFWARCNMAVGVVIGVIGVILFAALMSAFDLLTSDRTPRDAHGVPCTVSEECR